MNERVDPATHHLINSSSSDIERALIGACLNWSMATHAAMAHVEPEHFVEEVHQNMFAAMVAMAVEGNRINPVTLAAKLSRDEVAPGITMGQYIARCAADTYCPAVSVVDFARQVREGWALREISATANEAQAAALTPGTNPRELIGELMQRLDEARAVITGKGSGMRSLSDGADFMVDRTQRMLVGELIDPAVSTGLKSLDRKLGGGFRPGELIVCAGRPGMGKTTLAVSCARQMSLDAPGAFFSLEMPEVQIQARFMADEIFDPAGRSAVLTASQIVGGQISDPEAQAMVDASRAMRDRPLLLDYSSRLSVGEVAARARMFAQRFERENRRLGFIIIDYLKFLKASERYRGQRHYEIGEITGGLKALAKDMGIPVILLAQLNREVEKTADKRPELSHLRESGDIEADADVVMFLYREAYYLANDPRADTDPELAARLDACRFSLEIMIAKNRMGPVGPVDVFCHPGASALRDR
jgi:replicative DNA helicase